MTQPRRVLSGTTYLLSRRTVLQQFYFVPSAELNAIYQYALASAQRKHGFLIHSFSCLSNHPHEVVTDVHGVISLAMGDLRREIANAVKRLHGIPESLFVSTRPSAVELRTPKAVLDKVVYTILNPVAAGLVAKAAQWPGAISLPGVRSVTVDRPPYWFSKKRPATLTITITPPPTWQGTEDAWHALVAKKVAEGERAVQRERHMKRLGFLGAERVMAEEPTARPTTPPDLSPSLDPSLATSDAKEMIIAIAELRAWRRAYREARERWRADKTTVFPAGTWWVVRYAGASSA